MNAAKKQPSNGNLEMPENCTFSENNWNVLTQFWHPVAWSHDVYNKPVAVKLLDVDLVVYRTGDDDVTVALDRCPHRGSKLSMGWLEDDQLVCRMHGLHYDGKGKCKWIPSAGRDIKIPEKMCLNTFRTEEKYGLIWTCLNPEPLAPLPDWSAWEEEDQLKTRNDASTWETSAGRHVENFNDLGHLSWVHADSFGSREAPEIERYEVEETEHGLRFRLPVKQLDRVSMKEAVTVETDYEYIFTYPFASILKIIYPLDRVEHEFDVASPVSATKNNMFFMRSRNYDLEVPSDDWARFQVLIVEEDSDIVQGQTPKELPLDLTKEISVPADRFSMAYRKGLKKYGLE